ncbi:efflux RND transporter periplasmic adaptor subunit [Aestuariispira insulae]|uniref:Multidrug efflux system membrane fusion protein n=1 Tax=Aestuariispira insulae TaxID=1461337 RepID=A0A3D9HW02_9PROT|nr:efflux RND transporter periplasmic adaptor subunit [Aestuariispira insulae]RED53599.1 multidrug efflux system membrane fusion protein [Aestuariispira insulae]
MKKHPFGFRPSIYISAGMAAIIGVWLWSGQWSNADETGIEPGQEQTVAAIEQAEIKAKDVTVQTTRSQAEMHQAKLSVNGQTDFDREVIVRSEAIGQITAVKMEEHHPVQKGDIIARIAIDDRQAKLEEAKALLEQRRIEYSAAQKLAKRGFQSEVKHAEAAANLSAAKSYLRQAEINLRNTAIKAPFDGIVQVKSVEIGDYVEANTEIATIIDMDPIYVKGQVSEREIGAVELGAVSEVTLINGRVVNGIVSRVAAAANTETRTFEVAVEVPNTDGRIPAGITASLLLPSKHIMAHRLSPALLTLNDEGLVGVKIVDATGTVQFLPVTIIEDTKQGMWVSGLPQEADIITVGQEYVQHGQHVKTSQDVRTN